MKKTVLKGKEYTNKKGIKCVVLEDIYDGNKSKCLIHFINTGYVTEIYKQNLIKGSFTDPYEKNNLWCCL